MGNSQQKTALWYGIRVRSKFERVASAALRGKGYEEFLPLYMATRIWSDRSKSLEMPLFPGYLFCRFDVNDRLLPVLTSPGVIAIVGSGRMPVAIPDCEIDAIKVVIRSGLRLEAWPKLVAGTRVFVEKGPLAGVEGIALDIRKQHRLVISVALLQRSIAVEIDREMVRPVSNLIYRTAS